MMSASKAKASHPSHVNGEAKAEADAKAKAAKAAEAEAARVKAAKAAAADALKPLEASAKQHAAEYLTHRSEADEAQLALGHDLRRIEEVLTKYPEHGETIRQYAERVLPDVSGPVFGSSPAYRALQGARVAAKVSGGVGATAADALQPMHRLTALDDAAKACTQVFKAAKARMPRGKYPTRTVIEEVLAETYPKSEANTPGPAKGTQAAKAGAKAKAAKAKAARNEPTKGEVSEIPEKVVSAFTLNAAAVRMDGVFAQVSPETQSAAYAIAAATAKACADYGSAAVIEALKRHAPKAKAAKPKPTTRTNRTKPQAAKPTANRTNRTNRTKS